MNWKVYIYVVWRTYSKPYKYRSTLGQDSGPLQDNLILEEDLDFTGMEWHHVYNLTVSNDRHNGSRSLNHPPRKSPQNGPSFVFYFVYFIISQVYHRIENLSTHTLSTRNIYYFV